MENIGKQFIRQSRGYILLESLLALALLALLTSVMLTGINQSQKALALSNRQIEGLNTAKMAMDAGYSRLNANETQIELAESERVLLIKSDGKELLRIEIYALEK